MAERKSQAEEMTKAAREFTEAARDLTAAVDRLSRILENCERESLLSMLGSGGMSEEEANKLADEVVHEVRAELWEVRKPERGPLTSEEAEEWKRRRDERRRREGYEPLQPRRSSSSTPMSSWRRFSGLPVPRTTGWFERWRRARFDPRSATIAFTKCPGR